MMTTLKSQKVMALDLSSSCIGYAVLDDKQIASYGSVTHDKKSILDYGDYPFCYLTALEAMANKIDLVIGVERPGMIVIEETNKSRARYSQKALEMLHLLVLQRLQVRGFTSQNVKYIDTSSWRKTLGIILSKEQKRQNSRLSRAKSKAKQHGFKLDKKALGIAGRINKKHVAVKYVNEHYGFGFKMKDNDIADAICLGLAFVAGAEVCDGK
jgi:hypothetical protein